MHRLVASKTDGKMVQYECEGDLCQAEKIDALQLEVQCWSASAASLLCRSASPLRLLMCRPCPQYSYLLTSQLESQRIYWENKIVHLEKETAEEVGNLFDPLKVFQVSAASAIMWLLCSPLLILSDQQHEGQVQGDAGALRQPGAAPQ